MTVLPFFHEYFHLYFEFASIDFSAFTLFHYGDYHSLFLYVAHVKALFVC